MMTIPMAVHTGTEKTGSDNAISARAALDKKVMFARMPSPQKDVGEGLAKQRDVQGPDCQQVDNCQREGADQHPWQDDTQSQHQEDLVQTRHQENTLQHTQKNIMQEQQKDLAQKNDAQHNQQESQLRRSSRAKTQRQVYDASTGSFVDPTR